MNTAQSHPPKRLSTPMRLVLIILLGAGLLLFTMNHFHTSRCSTHASSLQLEENLKNVKSRLLQAESQVCLGDLSSLRFFDRA
jgi:hypothetical protein